MYRNFQNKPKKGHTLFHDHFKHNLKTFKFQFQSCQLNFLNKENPVLLLDPKY